MKPLTLLRSCAALATLALATGLAHAATTKLADQPIRATVSVPANVVFALSVEFPTADSKGHKSTTFTAGKYVGYFNPTVCYTTASSGSYTYFVPSGTANSTDYSCSSGFSGSFMNWATMQTIDLFRWAMTGGNRLRPSSSDASIPDGDTPATWSAGSTGQTILQRAYNSGANSSNFPTLTISSTLRSKYAPGYSGSGTLYIVNTGLGDSVKFCSTSGCSTGGSNVVQNYKVWVKVCASGYMESNCTKYANPDNTANYVYKPTGLIQNYQDSMNFGAFGYLKDASLTRDGGVMRARLRSVADEISTSGAFVVNPVTADATASGVTNSGVINYLNRFGYYSSGYKTNDPVSEMYAEVIKYYMNVGDTLSATSTYVSGLTDIYKDGFPVITGSSSTTKWGDPISRWCQKNFIIGIGDVNTHADRNLKGSTVRTSEPSTIPSDVVNVDAQAWTSSVGSVEGISGLGTKANINGTGVGYDFSNSSVLSSVSSCCDNNGYFIAGLAYYAHTTDLRPWGVASFDANRDTTSKSTVSTYWVDVLENQIYKHKNQYWLAAKYGGFTDLSSSQDSKPDVDAEWKSSRTISSYALPNNYFPASDADSLVSSLGSTFQQIKSLTATGTGVGVSSSSLSTDASSLLLQVGYDSSSWRGYVRGLSVTALDYTTGAITVGCAWLSQGANDTADTTARSCKTNNDFAASAYSSRIIATWSQSQAKGIPFAWASLDATYQTALGQQSALNYLRGDRSNESTSGYRVRSQILSDIVDSGVAYVSTPSADYSDSYNPGYSAFVTAHASRTPVVYVGANDGMLHAYNASASGAGAGNELWAYVPAMTISGPSGTSATDGLLAQTATSFVHHYYVNATPVVRDVDFARTGGATAAATTSDWRTLLVGGMGKGGKGFFAIDVTNPAAMTSETGLAGKVLWEITNATTGFEDMGYSYGKPLITKSRKWGWVVLLTSGYNNTSGTTGKIGQGVLYIVNPSTGALLQKIYTGVGSAATPSGLAQISSYTLSYVDFSVEQVYGGDLQGNLWRWDLSSATADVAAPIKFATLADASGNAQPITTAPALEYSPNDLRRWVFVGTGRLLDSSDSSNSAQQTMYAFRDGMRSTPYSTASLPSAQHGFPITRSTMLAVTDLLKGVTLTTDNPMGWYYDLPGADSGGATERIVQNPETDADNSTITWIGSIPSTDPCLPGGSSSTYSVKFSSGKSVLTTYNTDTGASTLVAKITSATGLVGSTYVVSGGKVRLLGTDSKGIASFLGYGGGSTGTPQVLNWRLLGN